MLADPSVPAPAPEPAPVPPRPVPAPPPAPGDARGAWARRSVTLKLVAIAAMTIVLLIPLMLLRGLVNERETLRDDARSEVSSKWGGPQTIGGPVLTVPVETFVPAANGQPGRVETRYAHFLPDSLVVDGTVAPTVRERGIFKVVLYNARLRVRGAFPRPDFRGLDLGGGTPRPERAFVQMGIPDLTGVRDPILLTWGGRRLETSPGIPTDDVYGAGVSVSVPLAASDSGLVRFDVPLNLNGSTRLDFVPLGKETRVRLRSPWTTPSFQGAFIPDAHAETADGFTAYWKVLSLNRNYGQRFVGTFPDRGGSNDGVEMAPARYDSDGSRVQGSAFGVELMLPVDAYQKTMRTAEYGLLFVLLTFATFFFIEVLGGRRVHPVQYLLVGFAICLFYLLLLALSEYVTFNVAYVLAAGGVLALVLLYSKAIFDEWRLAGMVAGLLLLFYVYFFVLLQLEELALLVGSLGLFVTLALVMYLSRRVDWYGMTDGKQPAKAV